MLVLSRKAKEAVLLTNRNDGSQVLIEVVEIKTKENKTKVRLAFGAPDHITIDRMEVHLAKTREGSRS